MYLTSQQLIIPLLAVEHGLFTLSGAPEFTTILYWGPNTHSIFWFCWAFCLSIVRLSPIYERGRCGRDRKVVGFTTTCTISAYHY